MSAQRRNQEYVDGSVYRIRLHNFLTYGDAELFPGPRLNVVIGPNGTGKSSIVCALCVGLGGSTKVLGRADKMGDFVQHEKDSGFTEIELFFTRRNVVIRRNIFRDNRSTWQLDGKESTQNKVREVLSKAKIQIDNLCQFLPQDKVGDFSRMTPTQLLKATQAAIGNGELADQQEEILKMEKENSTSNHDLVAARARLETKRSENLQRQRDVERIREQEARRVELANLKNKLLWVQYTEQRQKVDALNRRKTVLKNRLRTAKSVQLDPLKHLLEEQKDAMRSIRDSKKEIVTEKERVVGSLANIKQHVDRADREETETQAEMQSLKEHQRQLKHRLEREKQKEEKLHEELQGLRAEAGLREDLSALQEAFDAQSNEIFHITSSRESDRHDFGRLTSEIHRIDDKLARLENANLQRQKVLGSRDRDCMRAFEWVQKNSAMFQRKVWGPIALEVQLTDRLYTKYLEDTLQNYVLTSFVVECREDYNTMLRELNEGSQRLGVNVLQLDEGRIKPFQRPYSASQIKSFQENLGMTCYLDEVVKAPEVIHQILRDHGGIHTMLLGTQETEDMINRGVDVFSQLAAINDKAAFLTPFKKYVTSVSKYGNKAATTRSNDIREPRFLAVSADNQGEREQLQQERLAKQTEIAAIQQKIASVKAREKELLDAKHATNIQQNDIKAQLRRRQQLVAYISDTKAKIRTLEADAAKDVSDKQAALARKLVNTLTKHVKQLSGSREMVSNLMTITSKQVEFDLTSTTMEHRVTVISRVLSEEEAKLQRLKDEYDDVKRALVDEARHAVKLKERAERAAPENDPAFDCLPDSAVEIHAQVESITVALAHFRGDLRVLDTYEQVQKEIEEAEAKLARMESSFATLQDRINAIKDPWYAQLTDVVSKINTSFAQYFKDIGCVGEVHLNQDGGMDIFNERKVFSRITKSSCGSQLPQYFLITPKLITGLEYHPDTKVLVILNGPYNILQAEWDVDTFVAKRQKLI
ncbi:hypothetical protein H257_12617 [Aphanomyces astaci]|uniref:Structural maintenance of chromosomes protein 5 n=1 Tax=Aphanomyces astaci TaxID=112090 RepID=W4G0Q9_APHAT|nr:hypothetical protein H257_12617 [Aphanomyces astaci]ETV72523.1 hypothetical protein H257_12617 [Aphanomyces astaci]|eukprot:XP_009838205.1 hypothetical protein H257_12617 [Aphanomyces astaci]